jgi:Ni,Fe-hydrogenase III large subunit/Ni,Fe-hydrogenase III component G
MSDVRLNASEALERWQGRVRTGFHGGARVLHAEPDLVPELCSWLSAEDDCAFAGLVVEEGEAVWELRYLFYGRRRPGWTEVTARQPLERREFPSISGHVHAVDWHEREAEDLFGVVFTGHPRLGDFVLHDDVWPEGVEPMRRGFDGRRSPAARRPKPDWRPRRLVEAEGAFVMPVGPIFGGISEPVHFQLETVGEDVIRAFPRLFFKYRGVEKIAEGQSVERALLLAERFAATTAFAHALAFSRAVERIVLVEAPPRARSLRVFLAELERLRHHAGTIAAVCESTGLAVAASHAAMHEEELLRLSARLTGHRFLFGLAVPGGLSRDLADAACRDAAREAAVIAGRLDRLEEMLRLSSSYLDRLEDVGVISGEDARIHGLVGPIARASGVDVDLRRAQPYEGYGGLSFEVPVEPDGDGYARLRIWFAEARQSARLIEQVAAALPAGPTNVSCPAREGAALGWVEAPRGAAVHWLRLDAQGRVARYRVIPPSFTNWHGFHLAVERFAFQDFPIILATLGLSVAENDR